MCKTFLIPVFINSPVHCPVSKQDSRFFLLYAGRVLASQANIYYLFISTAVVLHTETWQENNNKYDYNIVFLWNPCTGSLAKEHQLGKPDLEQNRQPQSCKSNQQAVQIGTWAGEVPPSLHDIACLTPSLFTIK